MMTPMKYIFLAIFVLIAAQPPVQVSTCNMHDAQQSSQHASHDMDHGGGQKMDCCDHDPGMPPDHCNPVFHCGAHSVGVMAFNAFVFSIMFVPGERLELPDTGDPLNNYTPPPFKPPIA
jgi:hypothetical protein